MDKTLIDQPAPTFSVVPKAKPICIELCAPSGQLMAQLIIVEVPIEDIILAVLPQFRAQTGYRAPIWFRVRALTPAELATISVGP